MTAFTVVETDVHASLTVALWDYITATSPTSS